MYYNITKALEVLPYISWGIIIIVFIVIEKKMGSITTKNSLIKDTGKAGFVPPKGEGYEYYVSAQTIVYIAKKGNHYRVYPIQGATPRLKYKYDYCGRYFSICCQDSAAAESIVEQIYESSDKNQ